MLLWYLQIQYADMLFSSVALFSIVSCPSRASFKTLTNAEVASLQLCVPTNGSFFFGLTSYFSQAKWQVRRRPVPSGVSNV